MQKISDQLRKTSFIKNSFIVQIQLVFDSCTICDHWETPTHCWKQKRIKSGFLPSLLSTLQPRCSKKSNGSFFMFTAVDSSKSIILPVGKELEGQLIISDCCQECMISNCILVYIDINFNWLFFLTGKGVWWGPAKRRCLFYTNPPIPLPIPPLRVVLFKD